MRRYLETGKRVAGMSVLTYYAKELAAGMTAFLGGKPHNIVQTKRVALCAGSVVLVTVAPCDCHGGPSRTHQFSPIDLVVAESAG